MTKENKINSVIPVVNSLTSYMNYYLVQCYGSTLTEDQKHLGEDDLYKVAVSFIQLNMLLLKENIIENKGSLVYESKIYEETLTQAMTIIANINPDGTFTISNKTATKEEMFSFIRNKLAHGDYYYDDTNKAIVLNSDVGDVVININLFIQFYDMLIPVLHNSYKDNRYTRSILLNKTKKIFKEKLKTEKQVENYLHLFSYKKFTLSRYDGNIIPSEIKAELEKYIWQILELQSMKKDYKYFQTKVIEIFHKKGYLLSIENKKIKDKNQIENIKEAILNTKFSEEENDFELINYIYGDIISKIIEPKYQKEGIINANNLNLSVLKNLILLPEKDKLKQFYGLKSDDMLKQYYSSHSLEMLTALLLAKFASLYCYPLDDIYKKDNNYHLDRKDTFDFGKLNLSDFNPEIIELTKKGENDAETKVKSLEKKLEDLSIKQKELNTQILNLTNKIDKPPKYTEIIEKLKQNLNKLNSDLCNVVNELVNARLYYEDVKKDYNDNPDYFRNYAIIEGMRNSLAHGNVRFVNISKLNDIRNIKIEFTNIYKGNTCFKMTISLYDLQLLFEDCNIKVINGFLNKNKKEKVLTK